MNSAVCIVIVAAFVLLAFREKLGMGVWTTRLLRCALVVGIVLLVLPAAFYFFARFLP